MADKPERKEAVNKLKPAAAKPAGNPPARPARPAAKSAGEAAAAARPASKAAPKAAPASEAVAKRAAKPAEAAPPARPASSAAAAKPATPTRPTSDPAPNAKLRPAALAFEEEEPSESFIRGMLRDSPSWLVSLIVHMAILLLLALWALPESNKDESGPLTVAPPAEQEQEIEEIQPEEVKPVEVNVNVTSTTDFSPQPDTPVVSTEVSLGEGAEMDMAEATISAPELFDASGPTADLMTQIGAAGGTGLSGRGKAARSQLASANGASKESELAVALALKWLAAHQMPDGGWNYNHALAPSCQGKCDVKGQPEEARNAATAMALLPFLGAGQTHQEGEYKKVILGGLTYLGNSLKKAKTGGSWSEGGGTMYSHGLASIVMCEAYGMTRDERLRLPAQAAVYHIMNSQDKVVGGWGYGGPGQDTSVSGWQIMALKSAHMAYLEVWPASVKGIDNFLNFVQADSGASYGYTSPGRGAATTAVGLLCRMYMGWKKEHPALQRARETMAAGPIGPSGNLYRDYYAAQFMFQMTGAKGEVWEKWNTAMRDGLIRTQTRGGHAEGSWPTGYNHGRLMNTSLSTLILEVYYRHMPIQKEEAVDNEFPVN